MSRYYQLLRQLLFGKSRNVHIEALRYFIVTANTLHFGLQPKSSASPNPPSGLPIRGEAVGSGRRSRRPIGWAKHRLRTCSRVP